MFFWSCKSVVILNIPYQTSLLKQQFWLVCYSVKVYAYLLLLISDRIQNQIKNVPDENVFHFVFNISNITILLDNEEIIDVTSRNI